MIITLTDTDGRAIGVNPANVTHFIRYDPSDTHTTVFFVHDGGDRRSTIFVREDVPEIVARMNSALR